MDDEHDVDDVIEQKGSRWPLLPGLPGWRPTRGASALAVAALVVGLVAGYAAGNRHVHGAASPSNPASAVTASVTPPAPVPATPSVPAPAVTFLFAGASALTQDTGACSAQTGRDLQLGVQITNQSTTSVTLQTARAVLPIDGMLKQITHRWGPCGALPATLIQAYGSILQPGASTWLTVTFKVEVRCPAPSPVLFSVGYLAQGHRAVASLPGFSDLGEVPYSGCQTPSP
jgi:hypothetical protein